jgi:pimeloyl-ACP methyl ester carboxylesterase
VANALQTIRWRRVAIAGILITVGIVSVDRPGLGESTPAEAEPSLVRQMKAVLAVVDDVAPDGRIILVGHSFGAPVAARVVMEQPARFAGLVLVAPSIDPELETLRWYNRLASYRVIQWLLPREFVVSNREIVPLRGELERMLAMWDRIRTPVVVIQGGQDRLVDPGNAAFAKRVLVNADLQMVTPADVDHFIPWTHPELIRDAITRLVAGSPGR